MDALSELAYSLSPYRFAYNNPVYWSDPAGLFESRREARQYRREHNLRGAIVRNDDGSFSINDRNNSISYFRPEAGLNLSTMGADGVATSPLVTSQNNAIPFGIKEGFTLWGNNLFGDLRGHKNGDRAYSIETQEIPIMGHAARSVQGTNLFERAFSILKNLWDLWDKKENIENIANSGSTTPGTIEVQNIEPVQVLVPLYHYGVLDVAQNMPRAARVGSHDTIVDPSQKGRIDEINKTNYQKAEHRADSIAKQKGYN